MKLTTINLFLHPWQYFLYETDNKSIQMVLSFNLFREYKKTSLGGSYIINKDNCFNAESWRTQAEKRTLTNTFLELIIEMLLLSQIASSSWESLLQNSWKNIYVKIKLNIRTCCTCTLYMICFRNHHTEFEINRINHHACLKEKVINQEMQSIFVIISI